MQEIDDSKITRIEVINHAKNDYSIGRMLTLHKELGDFDIAEISIQDGGRTMKIFLNSLIKQQNETNKN
jgi:hypothetical protein